MPRTTSISFIIIGIAFLAMAVSGQRSFRAIGVAFVAIGIALLVRQRRRQP
jgi:hypothetical protein